MSDIEKTQTFREGIGQSGLQPQDHLKILD